ncbi:ABC transporter permease [Nocardioides carbamazepini]|uniref:ABC transporter permease n=1 Tax=Nocardioides carbamazepini TaxID=2854259 RepID=UPI00214A32BB|nr:ABC transporter permease [Nocardioides carbamazepini]MCR1781322.1 ABC transporter permease [Nocardioides carbamazepini]
MSALAESARSTRRTARRPTPGLVFSIAVLSLFTAGALLAPALFPAGSGAQVGDPYAFPSSSHVLGLDDAGSDVVAELLWGARVSLLVGVLAGVMTVVLGGIAGLVSGYFGGWFETLLMRTTDFFLVIPVLPVMIVVAALYGTRLVNTIVIIGLLSWPGTARVVRSQAKTVRQRLYVRRARAMGASHGRTLIQHVLPQVVPLLGASTALAIGHAIFFEAALRFLGLADRSTTSWGQMIADSFERGAITAEAWWVLLPPGLAIGLVLLSTTVIGRQLEQRTNPRLSVSHLGLRSFRRPTPVQEAQ